MPATPAQQHFEKKEIISKIIAYLTPQECITTISNVNHTFIKSMSLLPEEYQIAILKWQMTHASPLSKQKNAVQLRRIDRELKEEGLDEKNLSSEESKNFPSIKIRYEKYTYKGCFPFLGCGGGGIGAGIILAQGGGHIATTGCFGLFSINFNYNCLNAMLVSFGAIPTISLCGCCCVSKVCNCFMENKIEDIRSLIDAKNKFDGSRKVQEATFALFVRERRSELNEIKTGNVKRKVSWFHKKRELLEEEKAPKISLAVPIRSP